jgi:hypothetical protein
MAFNESFVNNLAEHLTIFLGGATTMGIIAHAVQTFPVPKNAYGAWLLGVIQFAVGQRERSKNTLQGAATETIAAPLK